MRAHATTSRYRDLGIAGALLQWLACLMSQVRAPLDYSNPERSVVDKILTAEAWANTRIKEPITLADWTKAINLNPVYFGRIFKQETGMRPMEWLNHRRLQKGQSVPVQHAQERFGNSGIVRVRQSVLFLTSLSTSLWTAAIEISADAIRADQTGQEWETQSKGFVRFTMPSNHHQSSDFVP